MFSPLPGGRLCAPPPPLACCTCLPPTPASRPHAQGLTLVRANHVILLEPALEPAIEQQAVARWASSWEGWRVWGGACPLL